MTLLRHSSTIFLALTLLANSPLWSAEFIVNDTIDAVDSDLEDGVCNSNPWSGTQLKTHKDSAEELVTWKNNAKCTLRAAIQEANIGFEKDTIIIPPGIYTLTLKAAENDEAENIAGQLLPIRIANATGGDLDIVSSLEVKKSDEAGEVILDGAEKFRFFDIQLRMETDKDFRTPEITLSDLKFINGAATTHGGAIQCSCNLTLSNIQFENNRSNGHGGALFNYSTLTSLTNVTFTDNEADGLGGALYSEGLNREFTIQDAVFTQNTSKSSGGAVYVNGNTLLIENSQFNRNIGKEGGALFIYQAKSTLSNLTIENNFSQTNGGGIYQKEGELEINKKTIISNNKSDLAGAGLYINLGTLTINKDIEIVPEPVLIENNESKTSGGALYLYSNKTPAGIFIQPTANINHAVLNNNSALGSSGGAIHASARITLNSVNITNNDSKINGAGIFLNNESTLTWQEGELKNNKSSNNGGGLYIVTRSSADLTAVTIENNWADNGAGIYSASNGLLRITDSQILENKGNKAGEGFGAGIFLESAIAMIFGTTFDGNGTSTDNSGTIAKGGAIISASSDLYIRDTLFENNRAVTGGAINSLKTQNNFDGRTTLNKVTLKQNRSTLYGGAIYHERDNQLTLINSSVTDNSSVKHGGGISALGPVTITYSTINDNHSEDGGGLYNQSSILIENSTISGNSANASGGGIYNAASDLANITLNNTTLAFNSASTTGSNLFADDTPAGETLKHGIISIENSIISNPISGTNCTGNSAAIISKGYNLSDDASCYFTQESDQSETSPLLEATLSSTENSTQYHALTDNSPAISKANSTTCTIADQRYHERSESTCDIGAYESSSSRINTGVIQFQQNIYQRSEQSETAEITVTRTGSSQGQVSIELFDMRNGTASEATTLPANPTGFKDYLRLTTSLGESTGTQTILSQFTRKLEWQDGDAEPISFKIKLANDTHNEGTETINLGLRNPTNGAVLGENSETVLEILDDDTDAGLFAFEKSSYIVTEGSELTIKVIRTNGTQGEVSVDYETVVDDGKNCEGDNRKGTLIPATEGEDYETVSGTFTFAEGEKEKTFTVKTLAESLSEKDETIKLILKNPTNGSSLHGINCTSVIFIDDSHPGEFRFEKTEFTIKENNNDNAKILVERLDSFNGEVTIDYNLTAGTATAGEDYQDISGTLHFSEGEKSTSFIIPILDNSTFEAQNETLTINLLNPKSLTIPDFPVLFTNQTTTASATLTIEDNDIEGYTPGIFSFTGVSSSTFNTSTLTGSIDERFSSTWDPVKKEWALNEGFDKETSDITLTVTRTEGSDSEVIIRYTVLGGTATEGQHFKAYDTTITFAKGETGSKIFAFSVYDDPFWSEDKTVILGLYLESEGGPDSFTATKENPKPPQTAALGEPITLTLINNDPKPEDPGEFAFNVASYSASEASGSVEVKVLRSGGTEGTVRVELSTVSLDGKDNEGNLIEKNAATPHVDFTPRENIPIAFKTGEASKTINITILEDENEKESEEIFQLELKNPQGGATLAPRRTVATVKIKEATQENDSDSTKKLPGGSDAYSGTGALNPWILFYLFALFSIRFTAKKYTNKII
ncbi:MAG: hypothetical protein L3J70_09170 [Gammaproteobacteria bacterium]|nr:hypothetical protein [Gammaproteobacteria bacterium]